MPRSACLCVNVWVRTHVGVKVRARARVCVCKNDLTSSIYFANKKVNAGAHVWSFIWQLCIEYMLPLWLWRLLSFAWWINFCRCKPNLAWEKNTKKLSTDWPAVFYLFGGLFSWYCNFFLLVQQTKLLHPINHSSNGFLQAYPSEK